MHTLGGIWVASFALWLRFFRASEESTVIKKSSVFFVAFASIFIIGGGWELFEFSMDKFITFVIHNSKNTLSDLFFDLVGSTLAVFLFLSVYNRSTKIENRE
jgi:hypothetical protein